MDFRSIFTILKGDVVGHSFHGNQWLTVEGKFNAGKVRVPRVPKPAPAKPVPAALGKGHFIALKTGEIAKPIGGTMNMGGAYNKGWQKVEMKDGSIAGVKTASDKMGNGGQSGAKQDVQNEILSATVGKALDIPIRDALPVAGHPDQCVSPWIEGSPVGKMPYAANVSTADDPELNKLRFFDQLVGNPDRFDGHGEIVNPANILRNVADGSLVGIDNAMAFHTGYGGIPNFSLLGNPSQDTIKGMFASLTSLQPTFASAGRIDSYNAMMDRFRTGFVNYVPA
jgi:hypothetical protein